MESYTTRPLEVKSLGLELPMQRKSTFKYRDDQGKIHGELDGKDRTY